jgi:hypothetical protein
MFSTRPRWVSHVGRRCLGLATAACVVLVAGAGQASASTTVAWRTTFAEPIGGPIHSPFDCPPNSDCSSGSGEVIGLGHAQDLIVFGAACGGACDVRWLTFTDGSTIVMHEFFSNYQSPGNSNHPTPRSRAKYGNPFTGDLADTIVDGTGRFAGATGTASGTVHVAGGIATSRLSGTVTF